MKISLIGDSIRMQYEAGVRERLGAEFEVFAPSENCRFAKYNLRGMWDWKEGMAGSRIVHWNCGLWDICDIFGDGIFTSVEEYVATVSRIADILLSRHDKVIFATTTPVRENNAYNDNEQIKKYNEAIVPVLREKGVIINDLHSLIYTDTDKLVSDDLIHLSGEGVDICVDAVTQAILSVAAQLGDGACTKAGYEKSGIGEPVAFGG